MKKSVSSSPGSSSVVEQSEGKTIEHNIIHTLGLLLSLPWFIWLKSAEPFVLLTGEKLHTTCSSLSDFNRQHSIIPLIISRFSSASHTRGPKYFWNWLWLFMQLLYLILADVPTFYKLMLSRNYLVKSWSMKKLIWLHIGFINYSCVQKST